MTYPGEEKYLNDNYFIDNSWRHVDRTFKCRECGKVWAQEVQPGHPPTCPFCNDEDTT